MSVTKLSEQWMGTHPFSEFTVLSRYDVYVDMTDPNVLPHLLLTGYRIESATNEPTQLGNRMPFLINVSVNGAAPITFYSGTDMQQYESYYENGKYYLEFSSLTPVYIPASGTEFTLSTSVTTSGGETVTFTEQACSPIPNGISGPSTIYTGAASQYTLTIPSVNTAKFAADAYIQYAFPSEMAGSSHTSRGFTDAHTMVWYKNESFSSFYIVPLYKGRDPGEVGSPDGHGMNAVTYKYYYYTGYSDFGTPRMPSGSGATDSRPLNAILLSEFTLPVTVVSRTEIESYLAPELLFARDFFYYTDSGGVIEVTGNPHLTKYGAYIEGESTYKWRAQYRTSGIKTTLWPGLYYSDNLLAWGASLSSTVVTDTSTGVPLTKTVRTLPNYVEYTTKLDTVLTNAVISYAITDSWGRTFTLTDTINVVPYAQPELTTHSVRRCTEVESGSGADYYTYNGHLYHVDDYGDHCLVEWGTDVTPLGNRNSYRLTIIDPERIDSGYAARVITLSGYTDSGYYVVPADGEKSYDVVFSLTDDFHTVTRASALSTVLAIMDFLRNGSGVAFGKVAELNRTFDIHRNWLLRIPQDVWIGNYYPGALNPNVHLPTWMSATEQRIQNVIWNQPVYVYAFGHFYNNLTHECIPAGYGTASEQRGSCMVTCGANAKCALKVSSPVTVARPYLHIHVAEGRSYAGHSSTNPEYYPAIYVCNTEPTTVDQSTGYLNANWIAMSVIFGSFSTAGQAGDTLGIWTLGGSSQQEYYYDLSQYVGQNVWIAAAVASGSSPSGTYTTTGYLALSKIEFITGT